MVKGLEYTQHQRCSASHAIKVKAALRTRCTFMKKWTTALRDRASNLSLSYQKPAAAGADLGPKSGAGNSGVLMGSRNIVR